VRHHAPIISGWYNEGTSQTIRDGTILRNIERIIFTVIQGGFATFLVRLMIGDGELLISIFGEQIAFIVIVTIVGLYAWRFGWNSKKYREDDTFWNRIVVIPDKYRRKREEDIDA